jgi:hypothetical protein
MLMGLEEKSHVNSRLRGNLQEAETLFNGESCTLMKVGSKERGTTCYTAGLIEAGGAE